MGLMDKVRAQSTQLAQMAQETAREGKVKLDQAQAKRRADAMFRDLGATVYAERTGRGTPDSKDKIDRLVDALSRQEASQGLGDPDGSTAPGGSAPGSTTPARALRLAARRPVARRLAARGPGVPGPAARLRRAPRLGTGRPPARSVAGVLGRGGGRDPSRAGGRVGRGRVPDVTEYPFVPSRTRTLASPFTCCSEAPGITFRTSLAPATSPGGYWITVWLRSWTGQVSPAFTGKPSRDRSAPVLADRPPISVPFHTSTGTWLRRSFGLAFPVCRAAGLRGRLCRSSAR